MMNNIFSEIGVWKVSYPKGRHAQFWLRVMLKAVFKLMHIDHQATTMLLMQMVNTFMEQAVRQATRQMPGDQFAEMIKDALKRTQPPKPDKE